MRIFLIIIMLCLSSIDSLGADYPDDIAKWISLSPPQIGSDAWHSVSWSDHEWQVYLDGETVHVKPYDPNQRMGEKPDFEITPSKETRGKEYTIRVTDGWLIGFNEGEWGGSLWWFSKTGKERYKISDDLINGYIQRDGTLFAMEGLAHLGISKGKVIKVIKNNKTGKYESITYSTLPEAPNAITLDKDRSMIIVTTSSLIRISLDGKIEKLVEGVFWNGLYPNSVVIDLHRNAYIGMRQGVARLSLSESKPKIEWLVPSNSYLKEEMESYKKREK